MKINWNKIFSVSASESELYAGDKIEFTGCKLSGMFCLNYLPKINEHFRESDLFYRDKDFNRSIEALEKAWYKAAEIKESDCQGCVMFFQATVIQSLEGLCNELEKMSKGLFATRRYHACYLKADALLTRIKTIRQVKPEPAQGRLKPGLQPAFSF